MSREISLEELELGDLVMEDDGYGERGVVIETAHYTEDGEFRVLAQDITNPNNILIWGAGGPGGDAYSPTLILLKRPYEGGKRAPNLLIKWRLLISRIKLYILGTLYVDTRSF